MKPTLLLLTMLAGAAMAPAGAEPTGQVAVSLTGPATAACDAPFAFSGAVTLGGAVWVPNQSVRLVIGGEPVAYGSTDVMGAYTLTVPEFPPGTYTVGADIYKGLILETAAPQISIVVTGDCEQP